MRLFVGIDGIDCAGKTTCVDVLRGDSRVSVHDEFTYTPLGDSVRAVISEQRFFSLSNPPTTRVSDTLVLLADWTLKLELSERDPSPVVVSDRCFLSVNGYQHNRLCEQYTDGALILDLVHETAARIGRFVSSRRVVDVLLTLTEDELRARIADRNEPALTEKQTRFLLAAQERMLAQRPKYVFAAGEDGILATVDRIRDIIDDELTQ